MQIDQTHYSINTNFILLENVIKCLKEYLLICKVCLNNSSDMWTVYK